ncbi:hypothetical protein C2845_PM05G33760 [Panicum miliaceum]|uniref:Bifunctional inhibitor/plant lipid transfer protein/seed storage helical domain-containing protein n=1 Tax=Panicum miliaceum TaxID=4540 RepID=A0A3L6T135_PANMI|nr:hypothetical protein C2845_PM05G33760 [Panicum miliaceum]
MASPKVIALLLAFAVAAAALQPSEAVRVQAQHGFKPAAASHEAEKAAAAQADGGAPTPPGLPAGVQLPPGLLPAILGLLFPPLGGIIGIIQPLLPPPGSPPLQGGALGGLLPGASPAPPPPAECMTPLSAVAPCTDYLTNVAAVATPPGECCDGLRAVVRDAPICLCHGTNGGMNRFLPRPVDPLRMAVLPLACGAVLPIQTLLMCNCKLLLHCYFQQIL